LGLASDYELEDEDYDELEDELEDSLSELIYFFFLRAIFYIFWVFLDFLSTTAFFGLFYTTSSSDY
jgi:hypothetical protein